MVSIRANGQLSHVSIEIHVRTFHGGFALTLNGFRFDPSPPALSLEVGNAEKLSAMLRCI